nr:DUF1611 domain-containing protein [Candidatus Brocadiaceae bacterium]
MNSIAKRRLVILTEGKLDVLEAKTAVSVIRYCKDNVVAVIDRYNAGKNLESIIGTGKDIPVFSTVEETLSLKPTTLLIGIAPSGGLLPQEWRVHIAAALKNNLHIMSGLHYCVSNDPEFCKLAGDSQLEICDIRRPPADISIGTGKAKDTNTLRVLTIGTDCNIGKMVTSVEIANAAKKRGIHACFVATGQTGIIIEGSGIAVDHVISDFISGAAEKLVMDRIHYQLLSIEGQGTIMHPAYSGVSLGLLHGVAPQGLILCHQPNRKALLHFENFRLEALSTIIELNEKLSQPICPAKVLGISLNCYDMSDYEAVQEIKKVEKELQLPATDPVKFGVDKFLDVISPLLP